MYTAHLFPLEGFHPLPPSLRLTESIIAGHGATSQLDLTANMPLKRLIVSIKEQWKDLYV